MKVPNMAGHRSLHAGTVQRLLYGSGVGTNESLEVLTRVGRALADPSRAQIMLTLLDGPAYPGELAVRWGQLGVWSPVNRLHATASLFQGKEPWRFGPEAEALMGDALRLRHRLLPYLATMAERASAEGIPLVILR